MGNYWKVLVTAIIGFGTMIAFGITASYMGYEEIDAMYYEQVAALVGKVVVEYPESEVVLMQSLKQLEEEDVMQGKMILKRYGYEGDFLELAHNKRGLAHLVKMNSLMMSITFMIIAMIAYGIYRVLRHRLGHLQSYLIEIAKGNYKLHIEGVDESKFSIFEDQIYKTTLALRESKEEQEKAKLNLAQNIADISHQLKTPLTSMGIMTDLLLESEVDEQNQYFIHQLNRQIERLSGLVQVLLKLAQFDSGTVKLKAKDIVISSFIGEVIEMLEVPIEEKEIKLQLEGEEEVSFVGDRNWTYEAIHNVLYNCIQHSLQGDKITIKWDCNPIYTEIIIQDQGGGISIEDLPHIFTRFYKGKNASRESIGIGLAMAKTIIEKQNGEIKVKNVQDGAQFQIKFY